MTKAIILAAGEGRRLRPYTLDRPKCLVEVDGRSLLDRQLDVLRAGGVHPIILVGGYLHEKLQRPGLVVKLNSQFAETNMVWTMFCAEEELAGQVIVSYGDIVYSVDILRALLESRDDIAVTVDRDWEAYWRARNDDPLADAETLKLNSNGQILELGQRPDSMDEIEGQYLGLMKFSQAGLDVIKRVFNNAMQSGQLRGKPVRKAYMTDLLQAVIDSGYPVQAVQVHGDWVEIDTVSDLESETTRLRLTRISS
jgi:choline kinase